MSRKFLLCSISTAALLASPALAADLPVKAPAPPPLAWSWAGFYLGAHGGYGWKQNDFANVIDVLPTLVTLGGIDSKGWVAGGQAGYNWQFGRWVAGLEVDGSATGIRGTSAPLFRTAGGGVTLTDTVSDDVKYLGTARARVGGAVPFANTDVLLYGTAGLAWERVNRTDARFFVSPFVNQFISTTTPRDHFGWVAGVGGEVRLGATNWIGRIEYLHYDFGTVELTNTLSVIGAAGSFADKGGRQTIDVVRGGLSYKFDSGSSPLSAYAASMPLKALPPLAWSWAGFYLGAHGGYGWKRNDFAEVFQTVPALLTLGGIDSNGWVAGGQAGYNWQFGRWVTGFEVDGSATGIRGTSTPLVQAFGGGLTITDTESDNVKYLGTVRARVGGAVPFANTDVLLYGTAGLAWERVNRTDTELVATPAVAQLRNTTIPRDHFGWVAGVGGEVRLGATNWIGRVEYLHYDFGTVEQATTSVGPAIPDNFADRGGRQTIDVLRAGLSYKFDSASSPLSAYAASMPVKALPPAVWSWTGFYIGGHGGYGWKQNDFTQVFQTVPTLLTLGGIDSKGWVAGGQAGYNWQFGRWVAGLEMDGSATGIRGVSAPLIRVTPNFTITNTASDDVKYLGTIRARVGGAVPFANTGVLLYGTAGLAWERVNRADTEVLAFPATTFRTTTTTPRDHFGWVAGVGGEVRLGATNWIGRVEYLHYDFGTVEPAQTIITAGGPSFTEKGGRQTIDVVRGGVSYKFAATP